LVSEGQLDLTLEHGEHLLEVVTVRRGAATGWNVHVDKGVFAVRVITSDKDRIGVPDEAIVRKARVFVWSSDREMPMRVVGRYGPSG
jgi:hypothetical protein